MKLNEAAKQVLKGKIEEVNEASDKAKIFDGNNKKIALNPEAIKTAVLKTGGAKAVTDEDHDIAILYDRDEDMIQVFVDDEEEFSGRWASIDKAILQFIKHANKIGTKADDAKASGGGDNIDQLIDQANEILLKTGRNDVANDYDAAYLHDFAKLIMQRRKGQGKKPLTGKILADIMIGSYDM